MKKLLIGALLTLTLVGIGGYLLYRRYAPELIAEAMVSDSLPGYIPKRLKAKVDAIRKPINKGTEAMVIQMHESRISMEDVVAAVDNITEKQAYAFLDDIEHKSPETLDEVFDIATHHFRSDIDIGVFREPFVNNFDIKQVKDALAYANTSRKRNDIDMATAKAIVKAILIEKEKELRQRSGVEPDRQ